jgi:hypothetical protein
MKMRCGSMKQLTTVLALLVFVGGAPTIGMSRTTTAKSDLAATSADTDARGQAHLALRGSAGKLDLKASRLARSASFDVVANGVKVGTLQTSRSGSGRLRFRSDPGRRDLLLGFDPRGAQISVRDATGHDVLVGEVPPADPNAIACCVPAADGTISCQEITTDACTTAGGVANAAATCLPDPCVATPPPTAVVCCLNETDDDESESECEHENEADCAAAGGTTLQADSCEPNPCAPVTPPAGDVTACCVTDEHETECEVRTSEACTARGGTAMGGTTCDPNPCGSGGGDDDDDDGDGGGGGGGHEDGGDD